MTLWNESGPFLIQWAKVQDDMAEEGMRLLIRLGVLEPVSRRRVSPYGGHHETAGLDEAWLAGYDAALGAGIGDKP